MEKKKILHIVESFGSGVFSFLVDLINSTDEQFDITVAYGIREETADDFKSYFSDKVTFIKVENFTRNISPSRDIKSFFEIKKIIKQVNPDVIHLHSSKAGFIGRFAANGKKIRMLYNPHGFSFLMKNSSRVKRCIYWLLEKIGSFRMCTVVGCSKGEYEEALKLTKNAICINNGINIEKMENEIKTFEQKEIDFNNLKICTSGRIGFQKNPKLFNEIAESFPNLKFTWIGDGELRDELKAANIEVTGWKKREEVLQIVNENDVFILTSLWEGLPISLLEAMYLKKVCIVTNCIGNRDTIKNNENGFILNSKNYQALINGLNLETYHRISAKAKDDILNCFNMQKMTKKYIEVYRGEK